MEYLVHTFLFVVSILIAWGWLSPNPDADIYSRD